MIDPKKLVQFSLSEAGDVYTLHIEDDGGGALELLATRDQLDIIADTLDDLLLDAGADEVDGPNVTPAPAGSAASG